MKGKGIPKTWIPGREYKYSSHGTSAGSICASFAQCDALLNLALGFLGFRVSGDNALMLNQGGDEVPQ